MAIQKDGVLAVVCPIIDGSEYAGIGVINGIVEEAKKIMNSDPAIKAEVLSYGVYSGKGFPVDMLALEFSDTARWPLPRTIHSMSSVRAAFIFQ